MSALQEQMEGLPGYDILMGFWEDYAGEHLNTIDPFEDESGNRRRLPAQNSPDEQRMWRKVQKKAWTHDKCFMGSYGVGMDCGLGLAPLVVLFFPVLGPIVMYAVHARLIHVVTNEMELPGSLVTKMEANIFLDLLITFPPIIGSFFGYLHACSTRNAGLIYKYFAFLAEQRSKNQVPTYAGRGAITEEPTPMSQPTPTYHSSRNINYNPPPPKPRFGRKAPQENIVVQGQQQSGFM